MILAIPSWASGPQLVIALALFLPFMIILGMVLAVIPGKGWTAGVILSLISFIIIAGSANLVPGMGALIFAMAGLAIGFLISRYIGRSED